MARPIWQGTLNFGLVIIPVEVYSATEDHSIRFRQFERGTSDRVRYRRVNERTGDEVDYNDIVKGYELGGGDYVILEQEELERIAPGRSRTIDIDAFVDPAEIDPLYFQKSYWLTPAKQEYARAYGLLIQAMSSTNRAGIATFVMRGREHIAAVRPTDRLLIMDTLLFAEDVRDPQQELGSLPEIASSADKELTMAVNLIQSMSVQWRPHDYRDTYNDRVRQLIEDKREGRTVSAESAPPEPTKVVDLFDALSTSVRRRKGQRGQGGTGKKGGQRAGSSSPEPDLAELTKAELENKAREQGISGRSRMTRAQLEDALRPVSAPKRKKRAS